MAKKPTPAPLGAARPAPAPTPPPAGLAPLPAPAPIPVPAPAPAPADATDVTAAPTSFVFEVDTETVARPERRIGRSDGDGVMYQVTVAIAGLDVGQSLFTPSPPTPPTLTGEAADAFLKIEIKKIMGRINTAGRRLRKDYPLVRFGTAQQHKKADDPSTPLGVRVWRDPDAEPEQTAA